MERQDYPEVLTLEEAASYLRVHKRTIFRLLERGELRGRKVGRAWRFHRSDLVAFVRGEPVSTSATAKEG